MEQRLMTEENEFKILDFKNEVHKYNENIKDKSDQKLFFAALHQDVIDLKNHESKEYATYKMTILSKYIPEYICESDEYYKCNNKNIITDLVYIINISPARYFYLRKLLCIILYKLTCNRKLPDTVLSNLLWSITSHNKKCDTKINIVTINNILNSITKYTLDT
jgi:hypothetical protein